MSVGSGEDLRNYEIQLQQVEAALITDPANEELLKLRTDLEEVMALTRDLLEVEAAHGGGGSSRPSADGNGTNTGGGSAGPSAAAMSSSLKKTGSLVMAPWSVDGAFYEAIIEDCTSDGQCYVRFLRGDRKGLTEACLISLCKPCGGGGGGGGSTSNNNSSNNHSHNSGPSSADTSGQRNQQSLHKPRGSLEGGAGAAGGHQKKKQKQQKKQQRTKQLEDERELEKVKWQSFAKKMSSKPSSSSGAASALKTPSIFASPDTITGRVGVGTCGTGGLKMTDYTVGEKYKALRKGSSSVGDLMPSSSAGSVNRAGHPYGRPNIHSTTTSTSNSSLK